MKFGFMDVILLHSGHQQVSVTHLQDGKNKYQSKIKYNKLIMFVFLFSLPEHDYLNGRNILMTTMQ